MAQMFVQIKDMPGSCLEQNHTDWSDVLGMEHLLEYPFEFGGTGGATTAGKQKHGALKITKPVDKASPLIYDALVKGKTVDEVTLEFYRDAPDALAMGAYFKVLIKNCRVVRAQPKAAEGPDERHLEEIGFAYQDITWSWEPDGVEATFNFTAVTGY